MHLKNILIVIVATRDKMLRTKCILAQKENYDGTRISIMSRHTLNDGVTPHPQINKSSYDYWMKIFAPPSIIIGRYYRNECSLSQEMLWEQFELDYLKYLKKIEL